MAAEVTKDQAVRRNRAERRRAARLERQLRAAIERARMRTDLTGCTTEHAAINRVQAQLEADYGERSVIAAQARMRFARLRGIIKAQEAAVAEHQRRPWTRFKAWWAGLAARLFASGEPGLTPAELAAAPERAGHQRSMAGHERGPAP